MINSLDLQDLEARLKKYISNLNTKDYNFNPVNSGNNSNGNNMQLGFLCYALKTMYTLNDSKLDNNDYINGILKKNKFISRDWHQLL